MVDARAGLPFTGTRVIELATGIAGPYCGKMLVDAGAEVVKIEPAAGDPLRAWTASGRELDGEDGVLFQYLNASKRSVVLDLEDPALAELWAGAHLVIESGQLSDEQILGLRDAHPHLGVVSITPWGRTGPCRDDASTEFTLQALCGSMAGRGTPDREPLHAGGRLGEWIAGVNGAVAAAALLLAQGRSGRGDHADVSHLEAMAVAMSGYASLRKSLLADAFSATRNVELPSIEPVGDGGYVGFCTITRQQFSDFLIMIGHGDLIDDDELASSAGRHGRQSEFLKMVHEWTAARTIEEIVDLATAFRIPVAPIGEPSTVMDFDQFVERGVYVANPGGFRQPRRPYLIDDRPAPSVGAAPELGRGAMPRWEAIAGPAGVGDDLPPLAGIRVVDLTAFWAGPSATQMLAALGADVIKVESIQRPDGMRFSGGRTGGDQWWEWGGMFHAVNMNKRGVTFDLGRPEGIDLVLRLVETADVVIENFSPRVMENFGLTRRRLQDANPKLIVCRMPAFGLTGPWRDRTGFAQTMEQASGMAWLTGFDDGPPILPHGPCDPIAGMHAAFAVIGCLHDVRGHGTGHFLECAMVESALNVAAELVLEHQAYGTELRRQGNRGPVSAPQGVYRCAGGEESWIAIAIETDAQWRRLATVIDDADWMLRPGYATAAGRRAGADEIDEHLARWASVREMRPLVEVLQAHEIPAAAVTPGADVIDHPHLRARGFVESFEHPVIGRHEVIGLPFRLRSRGDEGWNLTPAPTLGQHNREVCTEILGLREDELAVLAESGVIGARLAGH